MARILDKDKYPLKAVPTPEDYIIGTDSVNALRTKNFQVGDLLSLLSGSGLQNGLLSGSVGWVELLKFEYTPLSYIINENFYSIAGGFVTLAAADPTDPRIDLIIVDTDGVVSSITGTPAPSPQKPVIVDNSLQLELTFVTVGAGATEPTGITSDLVYDENLGSPTEWDVTENTAGARITLNSITSPFIGTVHITASSPQNGDKITLTSDTLFSTSELSNVHFHINLQTAFDSSAKIKVRLFNGVTAVSDIITLSNNRYGFSVNTVNSYQTILIPGTDFIFSSGFFDVIELEFEGVPTGDIYFDHFTVVEGVIAAVPDTGITGTFTPLVVDNVDVNNYVGQGGVGEYYRIGKLTFLSLTITGLGAPITPGAVFKIIGLPSYLTSNSPFFMLNAQLDGTNNVITYYDIQPLYTGDGSIRFNVKATATGDPDSTLNAFTFVSGSVKVSGVIFTP